MEVTSFSDILKHPAGTQLWSLDTLGFLMKMEGQTNAGEARTNQRERETALSRLENEEPTEEQSEWMHRVAVACHSRQWTTLGPEAMAWVMGVVQDVWAVEAEV